MRLIPLPNFLGDKPRHGSDDERAAAFAYISEAWEEARFDGSEGEAVNFESGRFFISPPCGEVGRRSQASDMSSRKPQSGYPGSINASVSGSRVSPLRGSPGMTGIYFDG